MVTDEPLHGDERLTTRKWYEDLRVGDHAAHIYHSKADQGRVIIDMLNWMDDESRLVLISDRWDEDPGQSRSRLLDAAIEEGRFIVVPARRPLYASGRFRAEALRDVINIERDRASSEGYRGLVAIWDLEWLKDEPDDFEAHIIHQSTLPLSGLPPNLTLIGQYKASDLTTQQLERVMRVNQLVLEDGKLARQFWLVANSTMGRSPRGRGSVGMTWTSETANIDNL